MLTLGPGSPGSPTGPLGPRLPFTAEPEADTHIYYSSIWFSFVFGSVYNGIMLHTGGPTLPSSPGNPSSPSAPFSRKGKQLNSKNNVLILPPIKN